MEHFIELKANIHSIVENGGAASEIKTFFGSNWILLLEIADNEELKLTLEREDNDCLLEAPVEKLLKIGLVHPNGTFKFNENTIRISNSYEWIQSMNVSALKDNGFIENDLIVARCEVRHIRVAVTKTQQLKICISREGDPNFRYGSTYNQSIIRIGLIDMDGVFYTIVPVTNVIKFEWISPGRLPDLRERGLIKEDWITVKCEFGHVQFEEDGNNVHINLDVTVDALTDGVGIESRMLLHGDNKWFLKGEKRGNEFRISITRETDEGVSPYEGPIDLGFVNFKNLTFMRNRATMTSAREFTWTYSGTVEDLEQEGFIEDGLIRFRCEFERIELPNNVFIPNGRFN